MIVKLYGSDRIQLIITQALLSFRLDYITTPFHQTIHID